MKADVLLNASFWSITSKSLNMCSYTGSLIAKTGKRVEAPKQRNTKARLRGIPRDHRSDLPSRPVEVPILQRVLIAAAFFKDQTLCDPVLYVDRRRKLPWLKDWVRAMDDEAQDTKLTAESQIKNWGKREPGAYSFLISGFRFNFCIRTLLHPLLSPHPCFHVKYFVGFF